MVKRQTTQWSKEKGQRTNNETRLKNIRLS
jgi:hypothetical protein